ncbi:MAG: hypothetical protein GF411_14210 [Candidatus Lokiarchaeota archaeon]|nr:hypothetical protein [Candidatus Lokiarchaeota archaeon]
MKMSLVWSNDPKFYDFVWGGGSVGRPIVKVNAYPDDIARRFDMKRSEHIEEWMDECYETSSGKYKYLCVVCDIERNDDLKNYIRSNFQA